MSTTPSQITTKTATSVPNAILSKLRDYPPEQLAKDAIRRRAIEAVIWGMSAVNTDLMYQAMARETKGGWNQFAYWSRLPDWKNQTLTPNPTSCPSSTRRTWGRWCSRFQPPTTVRSPAL